MMRNVIFILFLLMPFTGKSADWYQDVRADWLLKAKEAIPELKETILNSATL